MKWEIIPHTRKSFLTTLLLLIAAVVAEVGTYCSLREYGLSAGSRSLTLLTFFPGGILWFVAFAYGFYFRLDPDVRARRDSRSL